MPSGRRRRRSKSAFASANKEQKLNYYDLDVPLLLDKGHSNNHYVTSSKQNRKSLEIFSRRPEKDHHILIQSLKNTGYSRIALSHTIYGSFNVEKDLATKAIPDSLFNMEFIENKMNTSKKPRKLDNETGVPSFSSNRSRNENKSSSFQVLRRLNVVVEKLSDLAAYSSNNSNERIVEALKTYDIIALSPRNEETFSSICSMGNLFYCDIITLDYTAGRGGVQLPYRIKTRDVIAATNRGVAFEIPYAPALIDPSKRKALAQTARMFLNTSVGVKDSIDRNPPRIIISSGERTFQKNDYSVMALRTPGDIKNFCNVVLGFNDRLACDALSQNGMLTSRRGQNRRMGKVSNSFSIETRKRDVSTLKFQVVDSIPDDYFVNDIDSSHSNEDVQVERTSKEEQSRNNEEDKDDDDDEDENFLKLS
mmetsp:Transcript_31575/g.36840  ORF Transcript_31575/g.36840 Transcript_31575/m.36840 type:complete len:422 (-) Transcript_31575:29-1294(-)